MSIKTNTQHIEIFMKIVYSSYAVISIEYFANEKLVNFHNC